jgi:hypothetical protein
MASVGIMAYGSLRRDPGTEIEPFIVNRLDTVTPFFVEFARLSQTRGGGATVVPHPAGGPVHAEVLVLSDAVSLSEAKDMLWRRETRKVGSGEFYPEGDSPNSVLVRDAQMYHDIEHVLYTDFHPSGKLYKPNPAELAQAAVASVAKAQPGMDGISYLTDLIEQDVLTPLTQPYVDNILALTATSNLEEALKCCRTAIGTRERSNRHAPTAPPRKAQT